jgi:hypothetical protein
MGLIKTSSIVSNIKGSIGGVTFQGSPYGIQVHQKKIGCNFNSQSQNEIRSKIAQLQVMWQGLGDAQRKAWQQWALFQNIKTRGFAKAGMKGQSAFIQCNFYALCNGVTLLTDPVFTPFSLLTPTITIGNLNNQYLYVVYYGGSAETLFTPCTSISAVQSSSRNAPRGGFRYCAGVYDSGYMWDHTSAYVAHYGSIPPAGSTVFLNYGLQQNDNLALSIFTRTKLVVDNIIG